MDPAILRSKFIKNRDLFILSLLSIALFEFIFGFHLVDFQNIHWLPDDAFNGFLGWSFYRNAEETFPLFNIYSYGMGIGSTIIYTDSLPIFALIFKPFASFLPLDFQYFGLWLLLSFFLTAFFGNKILTKIGLNFISKFFVVIILLLSPIVLERFIAGHFNLMSHWIILWGISLYQNREEKISRWLLIILVSILTHGYLFSMTIGIAIFSYIASIRDFSETKLYSNKKNIYNILLLLIFSICALTAFGYFEVQADEVFHGGWGGYRLDLLSFINPIGRSLNWSYILGDLFAFQPSKIGDLIEGFNYFGLGILLNILLAILIILKERFFSHEIIKISGRAKILFIFSVLLILFSLTNNVTLGGNELFTYNMPEFLKPLTKPFRASARFFWPVYYLIFILSIFINFNYFKKNYFKQNQYSSINILFLFIMLIQIVDISPGIRTIKTFTNKDYIANVARNYPKQTKLANATKSYKKIIYVFPEYANKNWRELVYFAYRNSKDINFGYFARRNWDTQKKYIVDIERSFDISNLDKESAYYFSDKLKFNEYYKKVSLTSKQITITNPNNVVHMLILPNK